MNPLTRLDQTIPLADEERMLLDSVRALARDRIAPNAQLIDRTGEFPRGNVDAINALGLNAMFIPEAYGGAPMSYTAYLECVRELSKACASTGVIWATNFHAIKPLIDFGTEEQKQRLLPVMVEGGLGALTITEPSAGSDATGMRTSFRPDGDHVVVDGSKIFITNGAHADLYLVFGKWTGIEDGKAAISALVIEKGTPGLSVVREEDKMGLRASSTAALAFDGCRVPRANLLGGPGDGLRILLASLNKSRPSVAAHALGIARVAFEDAVAYINERRQSGRRIVEFQGIQFMLADMQTWTDAARLLVYDCAARIDAGEVEGIAASAAMAKAFPTDVAMRVTTDAVQILGAAGCSKDYPVERMFRDAKINQIWEGTNQIQRLVIARAMLKD